MPISTDKKKTILNSGQAVYKGYLLLDLCTNTDYANRDEKFKIDNKVQSFRDFVVDTIKAMEAKPENNPKKFHLNGTDYTLHLTPNINGSFDVRVQPSSEASLQAGIKPMNDYTPEEFISLLQQHPVSITKDITGTYRFGTKIKSGEKEVSIGGVNDKKEEKTELYPLHINNLHAMLKNLESDKPNWHMLVAMATGSGKSYTQALFFLLMYMADCSCVFSVDQENLAKNLGKDFARLLPPEVTKALEDQIPKGKKSPFYGILNNQKLLMDEASWTRLSSAEMNKEDLYLCFDEEHETNAVELYKKRVQQLAQSHPIMFLSATPSKVAYDLCKKPIASLSKAEKEKAGLAKSALVDLIHAKPAKTPTARFLDKLIKTFVSAIEKHRISSAHTYIEQSELATNFRSAKDPFFLSPQKSQDARQLLRWNVHCPIGDKALILASQHDPMVNLSEILHQDEIYVYKRGNRVDRDAVYNFFSLGTNLDRSGFEAQEQAKKQLRIKSMEHYLTQHLALDPALAKSQVSQYVDFNNTKNYMNYRVYHGLIENTLKFLLQLDTARLDFERFHDLDGLLARVKERLSQLPAKDIEAALIAHLSPDFPANPELTGHIAKAMQALISDFKKADEDMKKTIVDNWHLDKKLHNHYEQKLKLNPLVGPLVKRFNTVFLMKGLSTSATPVEDNQPFFKLLVGSENLRDSKKSQQVPFKHQLSTLEAIDESVPQYMYTPDYGSAPSFSTSDPVQPLILNQKLTSDETDTLFKKDLIGSYVSSERSTGFNDPNLQHVALLLDTNDPLNQPDQIIQSAGRNRGLNWARQAYFILVQDEFVKTSFNPALLEKDDYFPDLFKARSRAHKDTVKRMGSRMALELQLFLDSALDPRGNIAPDLLREQWQTTVLREFDVIYKKNGHDIEKARREFSHVLNDTYRALFVNAKQLQKSYSIPFVAKFIGYLLNFITQVAYYLATRKSYSEFKKAVQNIKPEQSQELAYAHIVSKYDYRKYVGKTISAKILLEAIKEDSTKTLEHALKNELGSYLQDDVKDKLNDYFKNQITQQVIVYIGSPEQQIELMQLINNCKDWSSELFKFQNVFKAGSQEQRVQAFFEMIQENPRIKEYIHTQGIKFNPEERTQKILKIQEEFVNIITTSQTGIDSIRQIPAKINQLIKDRLEHFLVGLPTAVAQFLIKNKAEFNFTLKILAQLNQLDLNNPEQITCFLTSALPERLQKDCPSIKTETKNLDEMKTFFTNFQEEPAKSLDWEKLRPLMSKSLAAYLESKVFRDMFDTVFNPLTEKHLLTVLDALYPRTDNKKKLKTIQDFQTDLKAGMKAEPLLKKYGCADLEKSLLADISKWTAEVGEEVLDCVCYYRNTTDKGNTTSHPKAPKLKTKVGGVQVLLPENNKINWETESDTPSMVPGVRATESSTSIWNLHATKNPNILTIIGLKTQFIMATLDAFPLMNKVEYLKSKKLEHGLKMVAEHVVSATKDGFANKGKKSLENHPQKDNYSKSHALGLAFYSAKSLSPEEIRSGKTKHLSAVDKVRENLENIGSKKP